MHVPHAHPFSMSCPEEVYVHQYSCCKIYFKMHRNQRMKKMASNSLKHFVTTVITSQRKTSQHMNISDCIYLISSVVFHGRRTARQGTRSHLVLIGVLYVASSGMRSPTRTNEVGRPIRTPLCSISSTLRIIISWSVFFCNFQFFLYFQNILNFQKLIYLKF